MPTIEGTILEVSRDLNDQDTSTSAGPYFRWSYDDLQEYYNDAVTQIANLCPHLVVSNVNVPIVIPGSRHPLPGTVIDLLAVNYATIAPSACVLEIPLVRVDSGFVKSFFRGCRPTGNNYRPYNWAYEPTEPNFVYIYPQVPPNVTISINITYRGTPPYIYSGSEPFQGKYHQPIVSWMKARAFDVDHESESSLKLATIHRTDFFKFMNAIIEADQALHAGTYRAPGRRK